MGEEGFIEILISSLWRRLTLATMAVSNLPTTK